MSDGTRIRGFRPAARRRNRIAAGVALGALAVAGNLVVYTSLDDRREVVQAVADIPAGSEVTADMLRTVEVDVDDSVLTVPADRLDLIVGQYAKVRIVSGSLVAAPAVQAGPLVSPGRSVVAVTAPDGEIPAGLRERSRVLLVLPDRDGEAGATAQVEGRVVALPRPDESRPGSRSVSFEVDAGDAASVAAAELVRIVLVEPDVDPALVQDGDE